MIAGKIIIIIIIIIIMVLVLKIKLLICFYLISNTFCKIFRTRVLLKLGNTNTFVLYQTYGLLYFNSHFLGEGI
jgi:hypothetical protein